MTQQPDPDLAKVWLGWPILPGKSQAGEDGDRQRLGAKAQSPVGRRLVECVGVIETGGVWRLGMGA